jgi:hypothetical protein
MQRLTGRIRRPVEREGAETYIQLILLSFAATVALTRLFLYLTGYPQIGGGTLHIAHLLWGGLALFVSAMLMLVYANRWVYRAGAVLAGVGIGLFMDEVGKFITQSNDYFFPAAAPIIYTFFWLVVLFYLEIRRPNRREPRTELYRALDTLEEVLDRDLDATEQFQLDARLRYIAEHAEHQEWRHLAGELLGFVHSEHLPLVQRRPGWVEKLFTWMGKTEQRWLPRPRLKSVLIGGLSALGLWALWNLGAWLLALDEPLRLTNLLSDMITAGRLSSPSGVSWLAVNTGLKAACGLVLLAGAGLLLAGRDSLGLRIGHFGLLLFLTVANLLEFYFEQFSTIVPALIQFTLLLGLVYYRRRYLEPISSEPQ